MFFKGSRYADVQEAEFTDGQGRVICYKRIRLIPETDTQLVHAVGQGERLDQIAYQYYRDPERFWRICDANYATWPDDLVAEPERRIVIPSSES